MDTLGVAQVAGVENGDFRFGDIGFRGRSD